MAKKVLLIDDEPVIVRALILEKPFEIRVLKEALRAVPWAAACRLPAR